MRTLLIDASSAILLYKGGLFQTMATAYRLALAGPVCDELTRDGYPGARSFAADLAAGRLTRLDLTDIPLDPALQEGLAKLHTGEQAVLAAMLAGLGVFVVIDDGAGALFCRRHAIPYVNALLCPRILKLAGRLSAAAAEAHMARIHRAGRYAPAIVSFAYDCEDASLRFFLP